MSVTTTRISASPATGRGRDPFIDLLRVGAIAVVVVGHWIMPVLAWRHGTLVAGNVLTTPDWWLVTWFAQVMPVFFVAGGAANYRSYTAELRRGGTDRDWLAARIRRLATPVVPLLAVWLVVPGVLRDVGVPGQPVALAASTVGQLLWFLAVYLLTVAATPVMYKAARRWGLRVPVVLGAAAFAVDMLRFHGLPLAGYANELLVWLAVQQLGIGYADGQFDRLSRKGATMLGITGFGTTALLVLFGPYPASMVGVPGQAVSNMSPATSCLLTLGVGQFGLLLARRTRLVRRTRGSRLLQALGPRCMTIYLWHMSALVIVAGIAVLGFGYTTPNPGTPAWLAVTPLWTVATLVVLAGLVRVFGRFESVTWQGRAPATYRLVLSGVAVFAGLVGIAAFGFADALRVLPWVAAVVVGVGLAWPGTKAWVADRATRLLGKLIDVIFTR